jgi:hypothetical protein
MKLFLDCEPELQPNGTYRYALNQVDDSSTGSQGSSVSEQGNEIAITLDGLLLGSKTIDRYRHVLFTNNNEISLYNSQTNILESLVQLDDFNFGDKVKVEHRVVRGCEDVIYFYDNINPDRQFNISRPELYQVNNVWDINLFNLNPDSEFPVITTEVFSSGGLMELGKYFFAVQVTDQNENVVYTSPLSFGVSITDDNDGGLNIATNLPEIGGIPKSTKSIKLNISNVGDYPFVRLAVFRAVTGDGVTFDAFTIGQLIPVTNGVTEFVFTGFNASQDVFVDAREIIVPKARYQTSKAKTQVDERLLRANLIESVRDYSNYQKFASRIASGYVTDDVGKSNLEIITELGGEVKAYGICYVHKDGTVSPPMHIPGPSNRPEDNFPITTNFVNSADSELNLNVVGTHQFVTVGTQQFSRITLNYNFDSVVTSATVGFSDGTIKNINTSGTVTHDLPVITLNPLATQLTFTAFVGSNYYFTFGEFVFPINQNVVLGLFVQTFLPTWQVYSTGENGRFGYYESTEKYINPPNFCGEDYWGEDSEGNVLINTPIRYHVIPDRHAEPLMVGNKLRKIGVSFSQITYPNNDVVGHFFVSNVRTPDNSVVVAKGMTVPYNYSQVEQGRYINNVSGASIVSNNLNHFVSNEGLFNRSAISGNYMLTESRYNLSKIEVDYNFNNYFDNSLPYRDLSLYEKNHNITGMDAYSRLIFGINNSYVLPSRSRFDGIENNSYSSNFNILDLNVNPDNQVKYAAIKLFKRVFPSVWSIRYRRIGELNQNVIYNGDAFISKLDVTNVTWVSVTSPFLAQNTIKYEFELIRNLYTESTINANYRHGGTDECNAYWKPDTITKDFIIQKTIEVVDGKPRGRTSICPEFYGYNKDYSYINKFNTYFPLGFTYNYCSDCLGIYQTRIAFSQKSFNEDLQDNYRVFLANNYIDIPSNTGEIVSMDYYNGKLVIRTTNSCFFLQPNPQQIQLSDTTAYIGTGDFLSLPAQELNVTDIGYAGQQDVLAEVVTEHGLIWVDGLRGKVYKLTDKLEEISRNGMYHWFKNNLATEAILTYDPEFERLLLTSNGFTISYSFKQQAWKSWHSYVPTRYFYNGETFFSSVNNAIWKHNSKSNCVFYDTSYDSVIEITIPNAKAYNLQSIQYYAKTQVYNDSTQQWEDVTNKTFDKGWVFNSNQSSGYFNITFPSSPMDATRFENNRKFVRLTDRMHKISGVYNLANSNSIINPVNIYDIEPINVDYNTPYNKLAPFRDKFLRVRLFFNSNNHRIITNMIDTLKFEYER